MNPYEKIAEGMRLIIDGCERLDTCDDCPFKMFCQTNNTPTDWADYLKREEDAEDYEDCDWGYNEDCGFDPYLGCYTDDC